VQVPYRDRPPRRNTFPGVCVCGRTVEARMGWVWIGGVYCRHPETPRVCARGDNEN
jgi:hypothetical protein